MLIGLVWSTRVVALPSPMVGGLQSSHLPGGQIVATNTWGNRNFTFNWRVEETLPGVFLYDYYLYISSGGLGAHSMILSTPISLTAGDILLGSGSPQIGFFSSSDSGNVNLGLPRDTFGLKFVFTPAGIFEHARIISGLAPVWGGFFVSVDPQTAPPMTVLTDAFSASLGHFNSFIWGTQTFRRNDIPVPGVRLALIPEPGVLVLMAAALLALGFTATLRRRS